MIALAAEDGFALSEHERFCFGKTLWPMTFLAGLIWTLGLRLSKACL
jgi:hypothetical protein